AAQQDLGVAVAATAIEPVQLHPAAIPRAQLEQRRAVPAAELEDAHDVLAGEPLLDVGEDAADAPVERADTARAVDELVAIVGFPHHRALRQRSTVRMAAIVGYTTRPHATRRS